MLGQSSGTLMGAGPKAPKRSEAREESPRVLGQGPGLGRACFLQRSLHARNSCWRKPSCDCKLQTCTLTNLQTELVKLQACPRVVGPRTLMDRGHKASDQPGFRGECPCVRPRPKARSCGPPISEAPVLRFSFVCGLHRSSGAYFQNHKLRTYRVTNLQT